MPWPAEPGSSRKYQGTRYVYNLPMEGTSALECGRARAQIQHRFEFERGIEHDSLHLGRLTQQGTYVYIKLDA